MRTEERPFEDIVRDWPPTCWEEPSLGTSFDGTLILDLEKNVCRGSCQVCGILGQCKHTNTDPLSLLILSFPLLVVFSTVFSDAHCPDTLECHSVLFFKKGNLKMRSGLQGGLLYCSSKISDCVS